MLPDRITDAPEASLIMYDKEAQTIEALCFSQKKGFSGYNYSISPENKERQLHAILLHDGYIHVDDFTVPSDGEGCWVACASYAKETGEDWVFVRDGLCIFVDSFAELFALKVQLAPWLLLGSYLETRNREEEKERKRAKQG
jgi:hypothetical protein